MEKDVRPALKSRRSEMFPRCVAPLLKVSPRDSGCAESRAADLPEIIPSRLPECADTRSPPYYFWRGWITGSWDGRNSRLGRLGRLGRPARPAPSWYRRTTTSTSTSASTNGGGGRGSKTKVNRGKEDSSDESSAFFFTPSPDERRDDGLAVVFGASGGRLFKVVVTPNAKQDRNGGPRTALDDRCLRPELEFENPLFSTRRLEFVVRDLRCSRRFDRPDYSRLK